MQEQEKSRKRWDNRRRHTSVSAAVCPSIFNRTEHSYEIDTSLM